MDEGGIGMVTKKKLDEWMDDEMAEWLSDIPAKYLPAYGYEPNDGTGYTVEDIFDRYIDSMIDDTGAHITINDSSLDDLGIACHLEFEGIAYDCPIKQKDVDDFIEQDVPFWGSMEKDYNFDEKMLLDLAKEIIADLRLCIESEIENAMEDAYDESLRKGL